RKEGPVDTAAWSVTEPSLEELLLAHLRSPQSPEGLERHAAVERVPVTDRLQNGPGGPRARPVCRSRLVDSRGGHDPPGPSRRAAARRPVSH
ncbi:hypothetical protein ABTX86_35415, partial [Streptomyces anulatus]